LILQLSGDKDPILRRAAMFTIGVAYAGTGSNQAVKKLLHFAVSLLPKSLFFHLIM